jgi:hypothetical protein
MDTINPHPDRRDSTGFPTSYYLEDLNIHDHVSTIQVDHGKSARSIVYGSAQSPRPHSHGIIGTPFPGFRLTAESHS